MSTVSYSHTDTPIADNWKQWIRTNLTRGCTVESMADSMANAGIDRKLSEAYILRERTLMLEGATKPAEGAYQARPSSLLAGSVLEVEGHRIQVMSRMKRPLITVLDHMLSPAECEELMAMSEAKLQRNTVVDPESDKRIEIRDRTSHGTFWNRGANDLVARIDRRIEAITGHPLEHSEGLQVMRYQPGGEYKAHFDYFPPEQKGSAAHTARGGQRVATMLMYLLPPEEGGETEFPDAGVTVVPKQGSAVYFEYQDAQGRLDHLTLHAGLPVIRGTKWIATRWIRERAF